MRNACIILAVVLLLLGGFTAFLVLTDGPSAAAETADTGMLLQTEPTEAPTPATTLPPEPSIEPTEAPTEETAETEPPLPEIPEPEAEAIDLGVAILVGDRAMDVPYANYAVIESYAAAVTAIAEALGPEVRTFSMAVPNAAAFYAPSASRTGNHDQMVMIDYCYSKLGDAVMPVETYRTLAEHLEEYIYFRTDHHWTQLGAYYAYVEFCAAAGFTAEPLDKFEAGQYEGFVGSMYTYLYGQAQARILLENPDTLYYYRPFVEAKARYYSDASLSDEGIIGVISYIEADVSNKYLAYCGGDHPIVIVRTDVEGPVCLLLKESYGNAMIPWLTSHYSKIVVVDPREFNQEGKPSLDLRTFAESQGANDCLILNYPMMLNSAAYVTWLERLVQ